MYEAITIDTTKSTPARLALTADRVGYDGLIVLSPTGEVVDEQTCHGVDIVPGAEIRAEDPETAAGSIGNYRPKVPILAVRGGTQRLNRFALEESRVDVLTNPMQNGGDLNHVMARAAAEHQVHIECRLDRIVRATGGTRVRAIADLRKLTELIDDANAPYVVTAGGHSHLHLRSPRALSAVGDAIGLSDGFIEEGIRAWRGLVERNRDIQSSEFLEPGVSVQDEPAPVSNDAGRDGNETEADSPEHHQGDKP